MSLHEQLLQSKIEINRYQKECQELQAMYLELKKHWKENNRNNRKDKYHSNHHISSAASLPTQQFLVKLIEHLCFLN